MANFCEAPRINERQVKRCGHNSRSFYHTTLLPRRELISQKPRTRIAQKEIFFQVGVCERWAYSNLVVRNARDHPPCALDILATDLDSSSGFSAFDICCVIRVTTVSSRSRRWKNLGVLCGLQKEVRRVAAHSKAAMPRQRTIHAPPSAAPALLNIASTIIAQIN